MYSGKNNEKLWQKYLRTRHSMSDIHPVSITDIPQEATETVPDFVAEDSACRERTSGKYTQTRILVNIRMTNGIRISKANLSHRELRELVEKLEVLC